MSSSLRVMGEALTWQALGLAAADPELREEANCAAREWLLRRRSPVAEAGHFPVPSPHPTKGGCRWPSR